MYLVKFAPGFGELVAEQLAKSARVVGVEQDIALFEAARAPDMPYASSLFRVLGSYPARSMGELLRAAARDTRYVAALRGAAQGETFRIRCMKGDSAVSADSAQILQLERNVAAAGLSVHRTKPRHELRLWLRDHGNGLFLMRLTHGERQKETPRGALRPDLCHMLCLLAKVDKNDACLDPFCGHGSLPRAMARYAASVTASDVDARMVSPLKGLKGVRAVVADALEGSLPAHSFSAIITDPPWGLYKPQQREDFFLSMFRSFRRVLKPGGRAVLLLERSLPAEEAALANGFALERRFDALYAGHKVKALLFLDRRENIPPGENDDIPD